MNNEEIRSLIQEHQNAILEVIQRAGTFELNPEAAAHQQQIAELRHQCNHLNPKGKVQTFNGRCIYCGTKL